MGIKGAILGDIIGSKYEFTGCKNPHTCELITPENFFTDDTILSVATKYAIDNCTSFDYAYKYFTSKYRSYPSAGWGTNFIRWAFYGGMGHRQSIGNGSAMRVGYISDYTTDLDFIKNLAKESAETTHNTVEGITGAVVTAVCSAMARVGESKDEILKYSEKAYGIMVQKPLSYYRVNYEWSELCRNSVPLAIRCFYESTDFESCMRNILSIYCDSDTIGAIAGNIAESYYGKTIPNEDDVLINKLDPFMCEVLKL